MATEHLPEYPGSFQQLADARRVLRVTNRLRSAPVLLADERLELERARAVAIRCIEAATAELIETLDALHDPEAEEDDPAEDNGDAERSAWVERVNQTRPALTPKPADFRSHEDVEDDDPQGEVTDDDAAFDKRSLALANRTGSGPGCPISDPDYGGEEAGEREEGF